MRCIKILLVLILLQLTVRAQSVDVSKMGPPIKLKPFNNANTVIYEVDSVKFYFKRTMVIKYLKKALKIEPDSSETIVLKILKHTHQKQIVIKQSPFVFDLKTGQVDITIMQNNYLSAIVEVMPYLLITGKVSVYERTKQVFLKGIYPSDYPGLDIRGTTDYIKIFDPDGRLLYSKLLINSTIMNEIF